MLTKHMLKDMEEGVKNKKKMEDENRRWLRGDNLR